jgi:peptidoglycan/xylan/chitin deacetylase (PgdA/CDA1 family)
VGLRNDARNLVLKTASGLRLNELALSLYAQRQNSSRIVVVAMHETLSEHADELRQQLQWASEHFTFIDPETFAEASRKKARTWAGSRPAALFTFDDGRASNYQVAAPLLESFGTRGIFFVVPQFIGRRGEDARNFHYSKIDIRKNASGSAQDDEIWKPMSPDEVADLARRGHWIGNHTLSHTTLAGRSDSELQCEIQEGSRQIACWTGKSVTAFAWPYSWDAIDRNAWALVKKNHEFCFAPCPGTVDLARDSPHLIWRKEIESYYSPSEYRFMYSGLVDPIWATHRKKLRAMLCD